VGVPEGGCVIKGEHGTASADDTFASALAAINAVREDAGWKPVVFRAGSIITEPLAKGLPGVQSKGNPRHKGMIEQMHATLKNYADAITAYNDSVPEDDQIEYTDIVALLMKSVSSIINVISYVLIAFVAISLVVSSIMIGIITYISVLERTKEIGILRAIGASKRDVSRVFNAETFIIGLFAGAIGIGLTLLLNIPINIIVHDLTGIQSLNASLPALGGVGLVGVSVVLTFIAGLIPSGLAAKKDPVEALRTE
jgi:ABC-type antimicrobial peptide transport system permease subunit